jgi:hypothetical protein
MFSPSSVFLGPSTAAILAERPTAEHSEHEHEQRDAGSELGHR